MDSRWLDDLVALAEAGTLTQAAAMRNVTQPAFTRRIQQIEQWLGIPVLDRSRRPARVTTAVLRKIDDIRALTADMRQLRRDVLDWETAQRRVSIAAQHSLSAGILPRFIARLQAVKPALSVRLRSANRDDCYSLLMTRQVSILVAYEIDGLPIAPDESLIERKVLGADELCPVVSAQRHATIGRTKDHGSPLQIIAYPPDVFLGVVFARKILPKLQASHQVDTACETALVPAALGLALEGVGVAWLPRTLCAPFIASGQLVELGPGHGIASMQLVAARLTTPQTQHVQAVWNQLSVFMAGNG